MRLLLLAALAAAQSDTASPLTTRLTPVSLTPVAGPTRPLTVTVTLPPATSSTESPSEPADLIGGILGAVLAIHLAAAAAWFYLYQRRKARLAKGGDIELLPAPAPAPAQPDEIPPPAHPAPAVPPTLGKRDSQSSSSTLVQARVGKWSRGGRSNASGKGM
ncbi:hypothetical protein CC85DRAFT_315422 [Cutaneotrichosporon oleaginosum]|uniref:Mid2 domain-containing protein n=1 Tax=Cutaneotrichosporon oleaginosum TaxID=879819 RepID=A0A0J0XCG1_9TREE|nr:uncharacterized protein CC85DRAFT_315422 [Cutaneotrichosporon oleaginosum]KLT38742.1 hypothetical protein CC85DRAFT_315422 [Cutaneotrichosporon oleaginosum]